MKQALEPWKPRNNFQLHDWRRRGGVALEDGTQGYLAPWDSCSEEEVFWRVSPKHCASQPATLPIPPRDPTGVGGKSALAFEDSRMLDDQSQI
jgi:hypothetical protein